MWRTAMKLTAAAVIGGSMLGVVGASVSSAATASTFTCKGTLTAPGTVPGGTYSKLTMPSGSVCQITSPVIVTSPLTVGTSAGLLVGAGSLKVNGNLTVDNKGAFAASLMKNNTPVNIVGKVYVQPDAAFFVGTETPGAPIFATIQGTIKGVNASAVVVHNVSIGGPVSLTGGGATNAIVEALGGKQTNFNDFEDSYIKGSLTEVGYNGIWAGVLRTTMAGSFTFAYNTQKVIDEYDIGADTIFGSAYCAFNNPAPNMGHSPGTPSIVKRGTFGNQAKTCTGIPAPAG